MNLRSTSSLLAISLLSAAAFACSSESEGRDFDGDPSGTGGAGAMDGSGGAGAVGTGGGAAASTGAGGTVGTGAQPGSGSASGSGGAGTGGTGGTSGGVGCAGADILCEDFESTADGEFPTGNGWLAEDDSCQFQSNFTYGVASDNPRGTSTKAFKLTNKGFAQCRLVGSIGEPEDFWVKAHIYWDNAFEFDNRETLAIDLATTESAEGQSDDPAVRFGFRTKDPCIESPGPQVTMIRISEGEVTGCADAEIPQGRWYCFEAHVQQSGGNIAVKTYIDGESFTYNSKGKPSVETVEGTATAPVNHIRLGIFSTGEAQGDAYVDDVAVATSRIGCD